LNSCAVIGGQFGSEGKGLIVGHIAKQYPNHLRVGAANAGHTLYTRDARRLDGRGEGDPEKHVMQQIPCAAYANPNAKLYIGPGALISTGIMLAELELLWRWRSARGLDYVPPFVDARAQVIREHHVDREQASDLAQRIGSTSTIAKEGIGAAQAARVMREGSCRTVEEWFNDTPDPLASLIRLADVPSRLQARQVLLEGTQGTGLSLTTGRFPFVTSRNTTAAGLCADAGVPVSSVGRVILVCRTYPIRVAGNSGPFWVDGPEIEWGDIGVDPQSERTTVTKKIRRVAEFSYRQLEEANILNGPTEIALTFGDYIAPELAGETTWPDHPVDGLAKLYDMIDNIEDLTGVPVTMVGTGPHTVIDTGRK
jgi:adenylosuccinate synthase